MIYEYSYRGLFGGVFFRYLQNGLSLFHILGVGVIVGERVILVYYVAVTVRHFLGHTLACLLKLGLEDKEFKVFLVFGERISLERVLRHYYGRAVVVAHEVSEVVIQLSVLQLLERKLVLHLEYSLAGLGNLLAFGEELKEILQFLYGLYGIGLVQLRIGRIEIITVSGIEACKLGVLAFGITVIIRLEIKGSNALA